MTPREIGFLLLTSTLGDPNRKILTDAQLRTLTRRAQLLQIDDADRQITPDDLVCVGYGPEDSRRIIDLLSGEEQLQWYLCQARKAGAYPMTRISSAYPGSLRKKLGADSPGCLWAKGDQKLLNMPMIGLVGSRDLHPKNRQFAREAGRQAALQGYALVSGNARGADREAQQACLENGGYVICVVADSLRDKMENDKVLYLSEGGFDLPFTPQRALHRNTVIHALAQKMLVAQCAMQKGGTWSGTIGNLRGNYSPVFCYDDGSEPAKMLESLGAVLIGLNDLSDFSKLQAPCCLFDEK